MAWWLVLVVGRRLGRLVDGGSAVLLLPVGAEVGQVDLSGREADDLVEVVLGMALPCSTSDLDDVVPLTFDPHDLPATVGDGGIAQPVVVRLGDEEQVEDAGQARPLVCLLIRDPGRPVSRPVRSGGDGGHRAVGQSLDGAADTCHDIAQSHRYDFVVVGKMLLGSLNEELPAPCVDDHSHEGGGRKHQGREGDRRLGADTDFHGSLPNVSASVVHLVLRSGADSGGSREPLQTPAELPARQPSDQEPQLSDHSARHVEILANGIVFALRCGMSDAFCQIMASVIGGRPCTGRSRSSGRSFSASDMALL